MSDKEILSPEKKLDVSNHIHPDDVALICKKLLGLQVLHLPYAGTKTCTTWCDQKYKRYDFIDKFETWAEAGLILDALQELDAWDECSKLKFPYINPEAIRDAALDYIRSRP